MIQLTEDLAMTANEYGYIVGTPRTKAGNGVVLDHPTYHATAAQAVSSALQRTMHKAVQDGTVTTFAGFIQEQGRLHAEFERMTQGLE